MHQQRPIAIVGFMGCGKTAVARILAAQLNREMVDLDERITELTGHTPAELISKEGEQPFRSIESAALVELLRSGFEGVVALGGGCWIQSTNRVLLAERDALTVWIDIPFEICWQRIETAQEVRPLAPTKQEARILFDRRRGIYELAGIRITSSNEAVEQIARQVELAIRSK
jgi:shikimate kinase